MFISGLVQYGIYLFVLLIYFVMYTPTTEIYTYAHTLSLHAALPISRSSPGAPRRRAARCAAASACGRRTRWVPRYGRAAISPPSPLANGYRTASLILPCRPERPSVGRGRPRPLTGRPTPLNN